MLTNAISARGRNPRVLRLSFLFYMEDSIPEGPDQAEVKEAKLDITIDGGIHDFFGVNTWQNEWRDHKLYTTSSIT